MKKYGELISRIDMLIKMIEQEKKAFSVNRDQAEKEWFENAGSEAGKDALIRLNVFDTEYAMCKHILDLITLTRLEKAVEEYKTDLNADQNLILIDALKTENTRVEQNIYECSTEKGFDWDEY